ncbi:MAG TPA: hypothetical protein GX404_07800 [Syntrophomonadaceae bacterium]|nr:hypothetical protein [Syntrophomonadaceae bacterium]
MQDKKGKIVSKEEFLRYGSAKEQYEGLLIGSDAQQNAYNIGVQLSENEVLIVDQSDESRIRERIQLWASQVEEIQRQHGVQDDLGNYSQE